MPGFLKRLFAPRWRHGDPAVRRNAIARLQLERDRDKLERLLQDSDREVRYAALERLAEPSLYQRLLNDDNIAGAALRRTLLESLSGEQTPLLSLEQRLTVVAALSVESVLDHIVAHADNQQLRLAALARIHGEASMVHHAAHNAIAGVRHAAAARVESDEGLERLTREARRDKQIARQARDQLAERRHQRREQSAREQRRNELIAAMTRLAEQPWEPMLPARYRHLAREWQPLAEEATAAQQAQFRHAEQRAATRIRDHDSAEREARERQQSLEQARHDSRRILDSLAQALDDIAALESPDDQDIAQLRAHWRLLNEQWRELGDRIAPDAADQQRFEALTQRASELSAAHHRFETHREGLSKALAEGDTDTFETLAEEIAWPQAFPAPSLLQHRPQSPTTTAAAATDSPAEADRDAFEGDLEQLEQHLERGELQEGGRLLDSLMQRRPRLADEAQQALGQRLAHLNQRARELRDWRSFAAAPKREQLIEQMESLGDAELDDSGRDHQHRRLVREWKALGDAAASRERSARFRTASDKVRERLTEFYRLRDRLREENLEARHALCEQLETLVDHPARSSDPDALRTIRDRAREEWRQHSPIPRERENELRQRFSRALRGLQTLIDQQARHIAEAKRELIEQISQLAQQTGDDERRAEQAKALQTRWRELGRAPRGEEQALWRTFRQHCDAIFERRNAGRHRQRQHRDERLDAMQALIDRLDQWQPRHHDELATLAAAEQEAEELAPLPKGNRASGMQKRWQGIVRDRQRQLDRLALGALYERWQQWQPLLKAHVEADTMMTNGHAADAVESDQPLPPAALEAHRLRNRRRRDGDADEAREWLEHLRVHLAVLVDAPLGEEDASRRLDVQVARLNNAMGNTPDFLDEIDKLQCRLLASGPITADQWQRLAPVLEEHMKALTKVEPDA
ncbi:DUF349 domain-containing protein [Kushneria aurantia]|uniref:DUF349 domain-containing protein n=1 Tax=Kushneria aurantia TaxID=504092 RepID=A0ABV6G5G0_9GAMM|nr:DUF349 domain-containing protein [Kushneria aurantia]